jgi:dolichol-phosphate mannosyltransferase
VLKDEANVEVEVSVVVPALREVANLRELTGRLAGVLTGRRWELVIVDDDSRDGTEELCGELSRSHPVRLVVRRPAKDGLSGAVLEGFATARGAVLVVMDADLQHPPEVVPELLLQIESGRAFVLGSRYVAGGGIEGKWGAFRRLNSRLATLLAAPFAGNVTDPMSGFFALPRTTLARAKALTPLGYKIALELMCKCEVWRIGGVMEVPIRFEQRHAGESKLTMREQFRYLEHLSRLYDFHFPRASPVTKFVISVALGWSAAAAVFVPLAAEPVTRVAAAYLACLAVTALLHARYVNAQREFLPRPHPWRDFLLVATGELTAAVLAAWYLRTRVSDPGEWELFAIAFGLAVMVRYAIRKELLQDLRGLGAGRR